MPARISKHAAKVRLRKSDGRVTRRGSAEISLVQIGRTDQQFQAAHPGKKLGSEVRDITDLPRAVDCKHDVVDADAIGEGCSALGMLDGSANRKLEAAREQRKNRSQRVA